jgi:hypothetical protein
MDDGHRTLREGVIAGALGATAVALWFLIVDTIAGRPFQTPLMLGSSMATFFGADGTGNPIPLVLGYTLVHFAAFIIVGLIVSSVVNNAESEPSVLIGLVGLFIVFEVAWYGWSAILSRSPRFGNIAWYSVLVGNLVAALSMGVYLWRAHPTLARRFNAAVAGEEVY